MTQTKIHNICDNWKTGDVVFPGLLSVNWPLTGRLLARCLVVFCLFVSCKTSSSVATSVRAITKTDEAYFLSVLEHSFQFSTFSARINLDFSGVQHEFSSRIQLKMTCEDRIQLSIQPVLGIEMFRIELSNDSIKILDRMNKRYMADNYILLKQQTEINLTFHNLQSLLTNTLFVPGENRLTSNHYRQFRINKSRHTAELQLKGSDKTFYTFVADSDEKLLTTLIENELQKYRLSWAYSQFNTIDNQLFPMKMTALLSSDNQIQGSAILTFSSPVINSPLSMVFTVPSGYSRVTLEQIINSFVKK